MIDAISKQSQSAATGTGTAAAGGALGEFGSALSAAQQAAQKAEAQQQQRASELDAIKSKGFSAWVRDTQIEALKEKLRKQVMADMGVDDDSLSRLSAVMREILEKKIQEEVERRMQEETAKNGDGKDQDQTKVAATQQAGKKDQDGKTCPVIPALSWPGAASLF